MTDFLRLVLEVLQFLWPFRPVEQWERGLYYTLGRAGKEVGPGRWPVVPYFMDVRSTSVVPAVVSGPLQTITLKDNCVLSFSVSATVQVRDVRLAINAVDSYQETIQELLAAVVGEALAEADRERFETARRRAGFLRELRTTLQAQTEPFGVEIQAIRFTSFVMNVRTYRFMTDSAVLPGGSW